MDNFKGHFDDKLNGNSLSRIWDHNVKHDCGAISAFRDAPNCSEGVPYTKKQIKQRNIALKAKLLSLGYCVTVLKGKYPEGEGSSKNEDSYWVVDLKDSGKLENDLRTLGEEFEQDSIIFVPKGSMDNKIKSYLFEYESIEELGLPGNGFGWWVLQRIAKKNWKDIDLEKLNEDI